jgi:hypothetical protein
MSRRGFVLPWILMIGGDAVAAWRGYLAATWYQQWQSDRVFDPSGAELSLLNAQVEVAVAIVALGMSGVGVLLFLRAQRARRDALAREAAGQGETS